MSSPYVDTLQSLKTNHLLRSLKIKSGIDFANNDTLNLSHHPELVRRTQEYSALYGVGSKASRLVSGNTELHETVEAKIAAYKKKPAALLFSSGFQANSTVLQALLQPQAYRHKVHVFADRLVHASLLSGIQSAGQVAQRFRHNDLDHLENLLKKAQGPKFIVTESVFSMDGDRCDIEGLINLKQKYGAFLYIDEAHATGLYGPQGSGLALSDEIDLVMGTFSKAMGSFGAFIACDETLKQYLINKCIGFIYTTALPPSILGSIEAALDIAPNLDKERKALASNVNTLKKALTERGFDTGSSTTHIIPLILGHPQKAAQLSCDLMEANIYVPCIRPPTVPKGTSRLRLSINTTHTQHEFEQLLSAL